MIKNTLFQEVIVKMNDEEHYYLFVYGTLRKGEVYSYLLNDSEFRGEDKIRGFVMRNLGDYPMVFKCKASECSITIEIYKINLFTLQQLDNLEDYREGDDNSLYLREYVTSISGKTGFIYYGKDEEKYLSYNIIPGGDWVLK